MARARQSTREYLWRRFCRIAPAYYAVLVVVYLVRGGTYTLHGAMNLFLHATFLQNSADFSYYSYYNEPGWPTNVFLLGIFAAALVRSNVFARLFSARWLTATGAVSCGVYLWHELVQRAVFAGTLRNGLHGAPLFFVGGTIALSATCLITWLSWRLTDRAASSSAAASSMPRTPLPFSPFALGGAEFAANSPANETRR